MPHSSAAYPSAKRSNAHTAAGSPPPRSQPSRSCPDPNSCDQPAAAVESIPRCITRAIQNAALNRAPAECCSAPPSGRVQSPGTHTAHQTRPPTASPPPSAPDARIKRPAHRNPRRRRRNSQRQPQHQVRPPRHAASYSCRPAPRQRHRRQLQRQPVQQRRAQHKQHADTT